MDMWISILMFFLNIICNILLGGVMIFFKLL